jgi:hypothetical protein
VRYGSVRGFAAALQKGLDLQQLLKVAVGKQASVAGDAR